MTDRKMLSRRDSLKIIAASGTLVGGSAVVLGADSERSSQSAGGSQGSPGTGGDPGERTIEWKGQGSEHAEQDCEEGEDGYWHWVLTRGGPTPIEEGADLTVTFEDGTSQSATGYFRGEGRGAVHFDVFKQGGGTVESASVTFSGGGSNALLTISGGECKDGGDGGDGGDGSDDDDDSDDGVPDAELDHWQVDFGEGENPPLPPSYWPDDLMSALVSAEDGVRQNPSLRRQETDGQLGDVDIVDNQFTFDEEGDPASVTVEFEVDQGTEARYLHLAVFVLPGPFDEDEIEDQVLIDTVSEEFEGGSEGELTLDLR